MMTSLMDELKVQQLHTLIERPDAQAIALQLGNESLSFGELAQEAQSWTFYLQQQCQLRPGQRVALFDQKSIAQVVLIFAVWRSGGVVVPVNPTLKAAQVQHILSDSGASLLITSSARAEALSFQQALPSELQAVITTDKPWPEADIPTYCCQEWQQTSSGPAISRQPDDLASLIYTSGSTGQPKGVMLSQQNLLLGAASVAQYLNLSNQDRILALLPFSFDYGLNQLLSSWYAEASVVLHNFFLPAAACSDLAKYQITVLAGVPPLWRQILAKISAEQVTSLRLVTNSGGALTPELQLQLQKLKPGLAIYSMYGLTEAFRSSFLPPKLLNKKPRSVGQAIPYARLMVVDEDLCSCEPGVPGELAHAGPLVAQGYWRQSEQTEKMFVELPATLAVYEGERAVLSGDLVYMDNDGDLFILGRKDEQIKTSGYRVSPQEVEELALSVEGVMQASCYGVADAELGQAIALVIQGEETSEVAFRSQYQMLAANYLWPKYVLHYESLPLNANGKIDRPKLKKKVINEINAD